MPCGTEAEKRKWRKVRAEAAKDPKVEDPEAVATASIKKRHSTPPGMNYVVEVLRANKDVPDPLRAAWVMYEAEQSREAKAIGSLETFGLSPEMFTRNLKTLEYISTGPFSFSGLESIPRLYTDAIMALDSVYPLGGGNERDGFDLNKLWRFVLDATKDRAEEHQQEMKTKAIGR